MEVKAAGDDAWLTAAGDQVSRYRGRYRLVLVTNTRDFVLVGEDGAGRAAKLETFRLADGADDFHRKLEKPRAFAREVGAGLGEYLCRALSYRAALAEPKDVAWLLASYARDGLARVEAAGDAPSLEAVRKALEDALGVRFEGERGARFFHSTLVQTCSTGSSPPGCCGRAGPVRSAASTTGRRVPAAGHRASPVTARGVRCAGRSPDGRAPSRPALRGRQRWYEREVRLPHGGLAPARAGADGALPAACPARPAATARLGGSAGLDGGGARSGGPGSVLRPLRRR